ncbi:STAS domain-containing protein [Pasteurella sp. PK-2025]|uniref:STAS domain-containing protein n=1 Tax=unclassified Pasteurella TaxID=2621516 RepID=UPI003C7064CE
MKTDKTLTWVFEQNSDNITLQLTGELSRNTLLPLWEQRASFLSAENLADKDVYWDLSQITRIDSAGFALLCDCIGQIVKRQKQGQRVMLKNTPAQLLTLADLFGLSDWIATFVQSNGSK